MKKIVFLLILVAILLPYAAFAVTLNLEYPVLPGAPNINNPENQGLDSLIAWFYVFIISIAGVAAFIMIIWGGIQWMSSSGNTTATTEAKDKIQKAVLGLLLILSSFIILQIINPELTNLQLPTQ